MNDVAVRCESITILYHGTRLFNELELQVRPGEIVAICGEAGSGKSALLEAIAGRWPIVKGKISLYRQTDNRAGDHPSYALVSALHDFKNLSNTRDLYYQQRYNSYDSEDSYTVRDYFFKSGIEEIAKNEGDNILRKLKIDHLAERKLAMLSNGETRKVLLASALLRNPSLLLLDNILSGLDSDSRQYFDELLKELSSEGKTIILTSSPEKIPGSATRTLLLREGKLIDFKTFTEAAHQSEKVIQLSAEVRELVQSLPAFEASFRYLISMQNVNVRYGDQEVLKNITWQVKPGERWALTGANGSGKTTLLSLVNGDNPQAYSNKIELFDRKRGSGESIWDIKRKIGFVSPELHQHFPGDCTCLQAVESGFYDTLGLFRKSSQQLADISRTWLRIVQLEKFADKRLGQLSYKEQRLCLLARALVKRPPLLILDEPFQGFDETEIGFWRELLDFVLSCTPTAMIMVSHYRTDFPSCITHELRLAEGQSEYSGNYLPSGN